MSELGLSARWSLERADADVAVRLREYVEETSYPRFAGLEPLRFKTWRMRKGQWFEGTYVFVTEQAREEFQATFTAGAAGSPVSVIVGEGPELIEAWEVVAVVEGPAGFRSSPSGA